MPRRRAKSVVFRTPLEKRKLKSARNNSRNDASNYEATSSSFTGFITSTPRKTPRKAKALNRSSSHQKEGKESPLFEKSIRLTSFVESASGNKTHRKVGRPPGKKSSYVKVDTTISQQLSQAT